MNLKHLTDKVLLNDTRKLVEFERKHITTILYHLREIERRRLFSDLGYASLFEYTVKELKYSEAAAMRRIRSARLLDEIPEIKIKIEDGSLSLTNLSQASLFFNSENIDDAEKKKDILDSIEDQSSRECGKTLEDMASNRPPKLYTLTFYVSEMTFDSFKELKGVLSPKRLKDDELASLMISTTIEDLKNKKFRLRAPAAPQAPSVKRYISAQAKKLVYQRAGGRCQKCGSEFRLEIDHITPYALGGKSEPNNLRLLCFSCNQRQRIRARL